LIAEWCAVWGKSLAHGIPSTCKTEEQPERTTRHQAIKYKQKEAESFYSEITARGTTHPVRTLPQGIQLVEGYQMHPVHPAGKQEEATAKKEAARIRYNIVRRLLIGGDAF